MLIQFLIYRNRSTITWNMDMGDIKRFYKHTWYYITLLFDVYVVILIIYIYKSSTIQHLTFVPDIYISMFPLTNINQYTSCDNIGIHTHGIYVWNYSKCILALGIGILTDRCMH